MYINKQRHFEIDKCLRRVCVYSILQPFRLRENVTNFFIDFNKKNRNENFFQPNRFHMEAKRKTKIIFKIFFIHPRYSNCDFFTLVFDANSIYEKQRSVF